MSPFNKDIFQRDKAGGKYADCPKSKPKYALENNS